MPQADLLAGSEAAEAINSSGTPVSGPVGPSVTVMGARGGKGTGTGVVLNCKGHHSFGVGCFLQLQPLPSQGVGGELAYSQRPLEDMGLGVGTWPGRR